MTPTDAATRRGFLAAAAALAGAGTLPGCLGLEVPGDGTSGYLQVKRVRVTWRGDGRRREDEVLLATVDGESALRCRVAEEYASIVDSPADIRVSRAMGRRLERDFADVTYVTGFCWSDPDGHTCRNARASRRNFNRVQFGDRAEVVFGSPTVEVVDVHEGAQGDPSRWDTDVRTFDFGAPRRGGEGQV